MYQSRTSDLYTCTLYVFPLALAPVSHSRALSPRPPPPFHAPSCPLACKYRYPDSLHWKNYFVEAHVRSSSYDISAIDSGSTSGSGIIVRASSDLNDGYSVTIAYESNSIVVAPLSAACGTRATSAPIGFNVVWGTVYAIGVNVEGERQILPAFIREVQTQGA